jgi:hypothetical protein
MRNRLNSLASVVKSFSIRWPCRKHRQRLRLSVRRELTHIVAKNIQLGGLVDALIRVDRVAPFVVVEDDGDGQLLAEAKVAVLLRRKGM